MVHIENADSWRWEFWAIPVLEIQLKAGFPANVNNNYFSDEKVTKISEGLWVCTRTTLTSYELSYLPWMTGIMNSEDQFTFMLQAAPY